MIGHYHKNHLAFIFTLLLASVCGGSALSQVLYAGKPQHRPLLIAGEQFQNEHYLLAADACQQYLAQPNDYVATDHSSNKERAQYYKVIAGIKEGVEGSESNALLFASNTLNEAYQQRIYFTLAQYYFVENKLAEAIPFYEKTNIDNLSNNEIADAKFELAYCYFSTKQFDKAAPLFASIKEIKEGKYYVAGNYYYGLLSYNINDLEGALKSFERIKDEKLYKSVVPYYLAEINYFLGNRTKAIEIAEQMINGKEKNYYDREVHLLAAQCYFEDQKYLQAKPYFEYYYEHSSKIRKEDIYKIGYCYYRLNEWANATDKFKLLSEAQDSLGQSSMYLLGDCYLKTGDRKGARNAFGICAGLPINKGQQEAAMIIYARLSYEAGYNDEAMRMLNELLQTYPNGPYRDEARTLLSSLLIKSNNFAGALEYLDGVTSRDKMYWQVYQQAAYGQGVQLFRSGALPVADRFFSQSLEHPVNEAYECAAYFWKSELAYKQQHYNDAITNGKYFLNHKPDQWELDKLSQQATPQHAYLTMGFASMALLDFTSAQNYFNQAQNLKGADNVSASVAALQEADAVFMQLNYNRALNLYDRIASKDSVNADYARYQKSIILGLLGKNKEKLAVLQTFVNRSPISAYEMTARYQMAVTWIETDQYANALSQLTYITDSATDKSFAPKAWLKTGFIFQQQNDNEKAIRAYKKVITGYPASDERVAALDALKSLFIQTNQPGAFATLLKETGLPSAENASIDSTYYAAAESQFATGKWEAAQQGFSSYLTEFPNGIFAVKAHYYRGQSSYQLKKYKEALADFNKVLTVNWNDFSENSARNAAVIAFEFKDYTAAYGYYNKLRLNAGNSPTTLVTAYLGLVKSTFNANMYEETDKYADTLMRQQGLTAEQIVEGLLYKAKASQQIAKNDTALALYTQLSDNKNGEIAAEAHYRIAEILYSRDSLADAETAANETIKLSSGYDYWIIKSYLLLADILVKQKDYFNAKATLSSIIKNTKNLELKAEATAKLVEVKSTEKVNTKLKEE